MVHFGEDDRKIDVMRPYVAAQARTWPVRGGRDRGGPGVPERVRIAPRGRPAPVRRPSRSSRPTGGSPTSTSTSGMTTSGRGSSRSARTSRTRSRCGSTATSGPNARPPTPGSGSPSCPTGSRPATIRSGCRPSATSSARADPGVLRAMDECLPLPLTAATGRAGTGGNCRCARSRCPAPSCSTPPATPAAFFEALVADNLDVGRPESVEVIFAGHPRRLGRRAQVDRRTRPGSSPAAPTGSP